MAVSEPARLALYNRLGEVIGPDNAVTLMSFLPLHPAVELATKEDVDHLNDRIDQLTVEMRTGLNEIYMALRHQMITIIGAMTALTAIFGLIVGLAI